MAAPLESDASQPSDRAQILARLTDGNQIAIFNWAKADLPDAEWFEVDCDDAGRIVLTPAPAEAVSAEAYSWAQEKDQLAAAQTPRPYAHLTVDELRDVEMTPEERLAELRARGIIRGGFYGPPKPFKPVNPPVPPGALERFLKERG